MSNPQPITDLKDRTPAVLLGYQQRWSADTSQVKVCSKSRRIGMSWDEAANGSLTAASSRDAGGMDVWYVGYNKDMAEEFIRDVAGWAKFYDLAAGEIEEEVIVDQDKDILTFIVRFASGFRVTALSSRPSNLRGKQGLVIIDEAAFHENLAELLKAALALLMWGGRVHIISTHDGVDNPFNELVEDIKKGRKPYSLHEITLDDALEDGLYKRICLRLGREWSSEAEAQWRQEIIDFYGDGADEELFCIPRASGGTYLSRQLIESCMIDAPVLQYEVKDEFTYLPDHIREAETRDWCEEKLKPLLEQLDPDLLHAFGEDFGRSGDLSVIAPICILRNMKRRVPFLVEMRNVPFDQQRQILFYIVDRLARLNGGALDARGNGQYLAEVAAQRYGEHVVEQVALSNKWYSEQLPPLKAAFEDNEIEIPKNADIANDLRALKVVDGIPKLPKEKTEKGKGKQRHGDAAIAIAMAFYASQMEPEEFDYEPVGRISKDDEVKDIFSVRGNAGFRGGF